MKTARIEFVSLFLFIILSNASSIFPQQRHKTEANADLIEYTNKEGLPSNNFSNIVQTKNGYIWISGVEGTYRFNGNEFEEVGEKYGVPEMQNMYYDSTNNILYFASPQKFISFDGKQFKTYSAKDGYKIHGLSGQVIQLMKADSKGRIWIGSSTPFVDKKFNGGLTEFDHGKFTVYDSTTFPLDNTTGFVETPYGDIIFESSGHNTQTKEGAYLALYKNGKFKRIDESMGINLQGTITLPGSLVNSVDKDGNTWIACTGNQVSNNNKNNSGVLMYDGTNFHQYNAFVKTLDKNQFPLEAYYSNKLNKVFVTTYDATGQNFSANNKSIYVFDNGRFKPSGISANIKNITTLNTGSIIKDFRYSACIITKSNRTFPELLNFVTVNLSQSSKYPNQSFSYSNGKWKKYDALSAIFDKQLKNGYLMKTSNGFGIYYPNHSRMLTKKDGLLQLQGGIPNLFTDKNGNVWISFSYSDISSYAQFNNTGINFWDGNKLRAFTEKDGLSSNITFNTFQDSHGRIWIPTSRGITLAREIVNSDGKTLLKLKKIKSGGSNKSYNATNLLETKNGIIYAWQNYVRPASNNVPKAGFYLAKFNGNKFVRINSPFSKEDNKKPYQHIEMHEDQNGRLWLFGVFSNSPKEITSASSKIRIFNGKTWMKPPASWQVPDDQLHYVGDLKNGMYFLTVGEFYNFNGSKFVRLTDSVNTNADFRILKGASVAGTETNIQAGNKLYIRLRNRGLVIFDGKHLQFYTKRDGLPSTSISNPLVDAKGRVFFSSPVGMLQVTGDQFQTYYDDENVASGGPYMGIKDGKGNLLELYNGVGIYVRKIENKSFPLKISSVRIDDKPYFYSFPQKLSYSQNSFVFNYSALNFKDPEQTTYEHILQGYDKNWSRASNLAFAEYQNLPSGKYKFKVKAVTSNGIKTNIASYSFIVYPPFWKTWWAYTIYVLFIGLGLVAFRKYEKGKILKKEAEKLKDERAAAALKEAKLRAQIAEAESARKSKELEEARKLQLSMLPKEIPSLPHLDIAVYMKTATEVGGDYYDFHLHPDGTLTVILGDATGHGMQSGMMVSIMKSLFMSDRTNKELKPFFENASAAIKDMKLGRLMMALNCIQINGSNKIVTVNAGMPPLMIYRNNRQIVEEVSLNNMPLGAMNGLSYDTAELKIDKGDTILMMSDGFAELKNDNEEMYGYRRARNCFEESARKEPEEIVNHLKEAGINWTNNSDPEDDVTFVVIKMK
jgi:serine phosphatase RsbU (regulator of sigma subunit)/ligand-binding sensor domain-containing protein